MAPARAAHDAPVSTSPEMGMEAYPAAAILEDSGKRPAPLLRAGRPRTLVVDVR
jgi:hypothetical protein